MHKAIFLLLLISICFYGHCSEVLTANLSDIPQNLQGNWKLDESTSYQLAQSHSRWRKELKWVFPDLLKTNRYLNIGISDKALSLHFAAKTLVLNVVSVSQSDTSTSLSVMQQERPLTLVIKQRTDDSITVSGASHLISDLLVWRLSDNLPSN